MSFLLLATQNTNVENICGTDGAKAKGRKEYCRDRCLTADGLGIELCSASVLVLYKYLYCSDTSVVEISVWCRKLLYLNGIIFIR